MNYFIYFAKYQNHIRWDDCSLQKVVKDTLPACIQDKLCCYAVREFSMEK